MAEGALFQKVALWVAHPDLLWARAGGMTVLERQLFTIARAGAKTVWIATHEPDAARKASLRSPEGLELKWVSRAETLTGCEPPYVGVSSDHFVRPATLAYLVRQRYPASVTYEDGDGRGVVDVVLAKEDLATRAKRPLPAGSSVALRAPLDGAPITDWLMAAGTKAQDGFMARHFDRHLSLAASRWLLDRPVSPNQMTIASTLLGLAGCACFLSPSRVACVVGALVVWLHSVLDGCDGELARVRFQESAFGADLDFWGDNLVHLALFTAIGAGLARADVGFHPMALAAVADAGVLASAWTAWRHRLRRRQEGAPGATAEVVDAAGTDGLDARLARLENALAQRDFIYLLVLLAFIDRVYEFLWAAAIGGLLYFGIMLHLRRVNEHEQARQPHPAR